MALDAFLELQGGTPEVLGETLDNIFSKAQAIEIKTFDFSGDTVSDAANEAERGKWKEERRARKESSMHMKDISKDWSTALTELPMPDVMDFEAVKKPAATSLAFQITKDLDRASPYLFMSFCMNMKKPNQFSKAKVSFRKSGGGVSPRVYLMLEFTEVYVVHYKLSMSSSGLWPTETVRFRFSTCKVEYSKQDVKGRMVRPNIKGYDLKNQKRL
jgi:type VI protein secretion system component Hcp